MLFGRLENTVDFLLRRADGLSAHRQADLLTKCMESLKLLPLTISEQQEQRTVGGKAAVRLLLLAARPC